MSIDGVALLVVVGAIPSLLVLSRIRVATDTMRLLDFAEQAGYVAVVCGVGAFLLLGDGVLRKMQILVAVDARYRMLGMAIGGFTFLVSAMVLFVDIWCRVPEDARQGCFGRKNPVSRFCQLVLTIVPVALAGVALFLRARSVI